MPKHPIVIVEHWGSLFRMSRKQFNTWAREVAEGKRIMSAPPGKPYGSIYRDVTNWTAEEAQIYMDAETVEAAKGGEAK